MTEVNFKINNKVEIISYEEIYTCDIQDVKDDYVAISIPIKDSQYLPLRKNERIEVLYYDGNCIYQFPSMVVSRNKSNIPLIWINKPQKVKKIQRRKYVRVPVLIDVKFGLIDKNFKLNKENLATVKFEKGTLLDLSGGGSKLKTSLDLKRDDLIVVILPIEEMYILVKGEIKRVVKDEVGDKLCGISFVDLKMIEQDKIVKYVFAIMREQMKKGLKEE